MQKMIQLRSTVHFRSMEQTMCLSCVYVLDSIRSSNSLTAAAGLVAVVAAVAVDVCFSSASLSQQILGCSWAHFPNRSRLDGQYWLGCLPNSLVDFPAVGIALARQNFQASAPPAV